MKNYKINGIYHTENEARELCKLDPDLIVEVYRVGTFYFERIKVDEFLNEVI